MQNQTTQLEVAIEDLTALNEQLVERLRLLNYEKQFAQNKSNRMIHIASFSSSGNPTEQFKIFKNLIKWLFQLCGINSNDISKYDDPMTLSTNIINQCKKLQIPCQFPPLKLKSGSGEQVIVILNSLATIAMKKKNFNFKKPHYEKIKSIDDAPVSGQNKPDQDEEMIDEADAVEQDDMEDKDQVGAVSMDEQKQIITSVVNENDWRIECQRVSNKLKVQTKQDNKQWRARIDSIQSCNGLIKKNFPQTRVMLQRLGDELSHNLQKISKSEKIINANMSDIGDQYKNQSQELKKLTAHSNNLNASIKQMNENHRVLGEQIEQIQVKINEIGSMTDNSPVVKIKDSLKKILAEIKSMDVRTGVLNHTILHYKSKERNQDRRVIADNEQLYDFE